MKRAGMVSLLSYIGAEPVTRFVVIFDDLKRFARNMKYHLDLRDAFQVRGVPVNAFVNDAIAQGDPRTPEQIEDGMWQPGAKGHHLIQAEREAYKSMRRGSLDSSNAYAGGL